MSPLGFRKRIALGPLRINLGRRRASLSVAAGPFTYNVTRRRATANLPGPFYWTARTTQRHAAALERQASRPTTCRCGHPALRHEHRWGVDCDVPRCGCLRYRRSR